MAAVLAVGLLASASRGRAASLTWISTNNDVWTSTSAWSTNLVDVYTNTISPAGTVILGCETDVNAIVGGLVTNLTMCGSGGTNGFPAMADSALFTNNATYTVNINVTTNVSAITFSNTAGTVTIGAVGNTLTVTGLVRIADGGATSTVYWSGGTLSMGNTRGELDVASNNTNSMGVFAVTNGTVALGPLTSVGRAGAASVGTFLISGPGVVTNAIGESGTFFVRGPGNGQYSQVIITNGGKLFVNAPPALAPFQTFSNSYVLVSGTGSLLNVGYTTTDHDLDIGDSSTLSGANKTTPGCLLIVSNGATVFADGTISFGRAASFNTGVVCGAGSQLISSTNGGVVIGITAGNANFLQVYNGGYLSCGGAEFSVDDGTGQFNGFQMGGTGAMSTGFAIQVRNNSNSTNCTITVTNAVFTCSEIEVEGDSNTLSVLANGTLIFSNAVAVANNTNAVNEVLRVAAAMGPGVVTINAGTVNAVSSTNAFEVTIAGGTLTPSGWAGNSMLVTNGGKLLSELVEIGRNSSYNTGVVAGVGSVWSNWTSQIAGAPTNYIHVGDATTITSSYNYLAVQNGALVANNGEIQIGTTNLAPYNTAVFGSAGAASTIINSGNVEVGVDGQTYGNTLIITNASLNCGSLSVGGIGATSNFLEIAAATITVNGPMYVAPTNTATFSSGVLTVGSMAVDPTANNGSGFVVGDGTNAAIYAMYTGDTGYHYFGGGLVVTNGATIEGNGTLVGNVTVLGTFAPGFGGVGSIFASNNLTFGNSAVLDYYLGTSSDSVTVNSNLTLAGMININNSGGFASGNTYLLFTYNGSLTYNGLAIGTVPIAGPTYTVNTNTPGQVNLVVSGGSANPFTTWQNHYFGSTNCALCGANASYTGDGMSNTNKFMAGFNGANVAAYLHIISISKAVAGGQTNVTVTYLGASGDTNYVPGFASRTNILEYTTGTANGSYSSNSFASTGQTNILGVGLGVNGGTGLGTVTNMTDTAEPGNANRYYRVRVLLP